MEIKDKRAILEEWVLSYSDTLFTWALHKVSKKEEAEDLVQETFLAAFKAYDRFKHKSSPKTWLFSILNNKIFDYFRQQKIKIQSLEETLATEITDSFFSSSGAWSNIPSSSILENTETELLDNPAFNKIMAVCLADLPPKWHSAITAKYLLEKEAHEICQELDLSQSNYWQVIHRAKLLLKKCVENNWIHD